MIRFGLNLLLIAGMILVTRGQGNFYPAGYDSNCSLNAQTMYPWVVRLWDTKLQRTVGHGSIIAYLAVLATCTPTGSENYVKEAKNIEVIAPHVFDVTKPSNTCTQAQKVREIIPHERCFKQRNEVDKIFDFAVLFMEKPFRLDDASFTYPVVSMPMAAEVILADVMYLNAATNHSYGCEVVRYANPITKAAAWTEEPFFRTVNFLDTCYMNWCEQEPANLYISQECERQMRYYETRGNVLCVRPNTSKLIQPHPGTGILWYAGAPFACNGTAYGHVTDYKHRAHFTGGINYDMFFVPTFLRVWLWLRSAKDIFGASWIKALYVNDLDLKVESFAPPSRLPITDQFLPFRFSFKPVPGIGGLSGARRTLTLGGDSRVLANLWFSLFLLSFA